MSEVEYCKDCGRTPFGCSCNMTFAEKIRTQRLCYAEWSATNAGRPKDKGPSIHL